MSLDQYELGVAMAAMSSQGHGFPTLRSVLAAASNLRHQGFDLLVGRDILSYCLFVYDGQRRQFSLAY